MLGGLVSRPALTGVRSQAAFCGTISGERPGGCGGRDVATYGREKCDKCGKPATILLTDVIDGKLTERRLCQACAAAEGVIVKTNMSLSELLEDFVLHTSSQQARREITCDVCGLTFAEFRQQKLLGCPHDYDAFEPALRPLIEVPTRGRASTWARRRTAAAASRRSKTPCSACGPT